MSSCYSDVRAGRLTHPDCVLCRLTINPYITSVLPKQHQGVQLSTSVVPYGLLFGAQTLCAARSNTCMLVARLTTLHHMLDC
jgi:hypothetical protein